jgi:hypothetical protein
VDAGSTARTVVTIAAGILLACIVLAVFGKVAR